MTARSESTGVKRPSKHGVAVLGRSAATGRYVLRPASKRGSVSIADVKTAVRAVASKKKS